MKTYSEISRNTGISISHVSRVLRGIRQPSLETMIKIAWELDLTADQFMKKFNVGSKIKPRRLLAKNRRD